MRGGGQNSPNPLRFRQRSESVRWVRGLPCRQLAGTLGQLLGQRHTFRHLRIDIPRLGRLGLSELSSNPPPLPSSSLCPSHWRRYPVPSRPFSDWRVRKTTPMRRVYRRACTGWNSILQIRREVPPRRCTERCLFEGGGLPAAM